MKVMEIYSAHSAADFLENYNWNKKKPEAGLENSGIYL
jgi:hypothetical protein